MIKIVHFDQKALLFVPKSKDIPTFWSKIAKKAIFDQKFVNFLQIRDRMLANFREAKIGPFFDFVEKRPNTKKKEPIP